MFLGVSSFRSLLLSLHFAVDVRLSLFFCLNYKSLLRLLLFFCWLSSVFLYHDFRCVVWVFNHGEALSVCLIWPVGAKACFQCEDVVVIFFFLLV